MNRTGSPTAPLDRARSFIGAAVMGMFMLVSRCLGLLRDINTAAVMGLSGSMAMDAFACAFRIPNIIRRFFEEGIFGLTFIPVFSELLKTDKREARALAVRYLAGGFLFGLGLAVLLEIAAALIWFLFQPPPGKLWYSILRFGSLMFPYVIFAVPAAQIAAVLQGLGRFRMAGFMPVLFNLVWLAVLFFISPLGVYLPFKVPACSVSIFGVSSATLTPAGRGAVLSLAIAGAAALQFFVLFLYLRYLRRSGKLGTPDSAKESPGGTFISVRSALRGIWRRLAPAAMVILFLQVNVLLATLLAALFSGSSVPVLSAIPGVDSLFAGKMGRGAASALYFGERLYEFPLSLVGVTVGTAFYPLLTRRALEKNRSGFAADFTAALRWVILLAIPSGVGLILLAAPLSRLFFAHGAASAEDSARIARLTLCFGCGVPAFCLTAFLNRAHLALGKLKTPMWAGVFSVFLFLMLALAGVPRLGEAALALAIALSSWGQTAFLARGMAGEIFPAQRHILAKTFAAAVFASAVMACGIFLERLFLAHPPASFAAVPFVSEKTVSASLGIAVDLAVGILLFFAVILLCDRKKTIDTIREVMKRFFGSKG
ncbi:MAG: hypothetical protein IJG60_01010 [Thermoguttaceae bacterium]|nr:hypothetical protein [Thermoguttaceae bacterium]